MKVKIISQNVSVVAFHVEEELKPPLAILSELYNLRPPQKSINQAKRCVLILSRLYNLRPSLKVYKSS